MATDLPNGEHKDAFRARLLAARNGLPDDERRRLDRHIRTHLIQLLDERDVVDVAAYYPFNGEPDLMPALETLHLAGWRIHLPVVNGGSMHFRRWAPEAEMQPNRFGIPEPVAGEECPPERMQLVLMPLVAFTAAGARLGMGAGFYDRAFSFRLHRPDADPLLIGTAYSLQETDHLPAEPWDVPMDAVVTDEGVKRLSI